MSDKSHEDETPDPLSQSANEKASGRGCSFTDEDFQGCAAMERALAGVPINADRKGLSVCVTTSIGTWKSTFQGVVYKVSARDGGVVLNACPWCMEPIIPKHVEEMEEVQR